jgi:hypothetical protein
LPATRNHKERAVLDHTLAPLDGLSSQISLLAERIDTSNTADRPLVPPGPQPHESAGATFAAFAGDPIDVKVDNEPGTITGRLHTTMGTTARHRLRQQRSAHPGALRAWALLVTVGRSLELLACDLEYRTGAAAQARSSKCSA